MESAQNDKVKEITEALEQGIKDLFSSEKFKNYLKVMSKFYNYSFNNSLLIAMQKPDATLVAGYTSWQKNFHRNVQKGEQGIRILAPSPYKITQEVDKIDPVTQKPVYNSDGTVAKEKVQVTIPAYKVTTVFDVSQTQGEPIPEIVTELKGDSEEYARFFDAVKEISPVPMEVRSITGGANGYYHLEEKRIAIREGMSQMQMVKTAIHEVAHAKLHDKDTGAEKDNLPDRRTKEVEAESVAYTVCQHYGIDTSDYSFGYIAGWSSGRELEELKKSMSIIRSTASEMISELDKRLFPEKENVQELQGQKEEALSKDFVKENQLQQKTASKTITAGRSKEMVHRHHKKRG